MVLSYLEPYKRDDNEEYNLEWRNLQINPFKGLELNRAEKSSRMEFQWKNIFLIHSEFGVDVVTFLASANSFSELGIRKMVMAIVGETRATARK